MVEAHRLLHSATGTDATATGTAGLAGVLALRPEIGNGERIAIIASGITRRM